MPGMHGQLFIQTLQSDPAFFFATIITVVISITLHELAHGIAAIKLGDDTPIHLNRMTLNPMVHMGGMSLILLAIMGIAFGAMPVDRTRLRGKYGEAIVAAAGPLTNLLLAVLTLTALGLWERFDPTPLASWSPAAANGRYLLAVFGMTNLLLMMFNLLPLPPLDGFWIVSNVSRKFRNLMSGELARGIAGALFFAAFLGAGWVLQRATEQVTFKYVSALSGRSQVRLIVILDRTTIKNPEGAYRLQQMEKMLGKRMDDLIRHDETADDER